MKLQKAIAIALLGMVIAFVLIDQSPDRGFRAGHRGWVSAHALAIIAKAKLENGFVGYTIKFVDEAGIYSYHYFDRYPVFFSVTMHAVLNTFALSLGDQIYLAREAMNVIYGLILLSGVALLMELELVPGVAVAAAAMAGAGHYMVAYRDMVHFDQPALLGFMILLWAIARWYRTRSNRLVYVAAGLAVIMGRGYASFAVLGCWWLLEALRTVRANHKQALRLFAFGVQTRACVLGISLAGSCLGYNIAIEARIRNVPVTEVGIVASALQRLSLDENFNRQLARKLAWATFSDNQASRGFRGLQPYGLFFFSPRGHLLYLSVALVGVIIGVFVATRRRELRTPFVVASVAGLAWLFPMRGLSAFHEYTTMYMFSLHLVFFAAALSLVPARAQLGPALLACACLVYCTHQRNISVAAFQTESDAVTRDFAQIAQALEPGEAVRVEPSYRQLVRGVPFALGFYLPDNPILEKARSTVSITKNEEHKGKNCTPSNWYVFLFRTKEPV